MDLRISAKDFFFEQIISGVAATTTAGATAEDALLPLFFSALGVAAAVVCCFRFGVLTEDEGEALEGVTGDDFFILESLDAFVFFLEGVEVPIAELRFDFVTGVGGGTFKRAAAYPPTGLIGVLTGCVFLTLEGNAGAFNDGGAVFAAAVAVLAGAAAVATTTAAVVLVAVGDEEFG